MWQTFSAASRFEGKAAAFFRDRRGETDFREADRLAGAHSVFRELPYQRNIQSGTFRIWSELEGRRWLNLWPFCERAHPNQAWLAEGYPSLFWKRFLKQTKRNPPILAAWIRSHWDGGIKMGAGTRKALLDPDCADAAVLCLCSFDLLANNPGMLAKRRTLPRDEGWIFGLERP